MRMETVTHTETFKVFDVGELVSPTSGRCPLDPGVYVVTQYHRPLFPGDQPTVFVAGRTTGLSAEYLQPSDAAKLQNETPPA